MTALFASTIASGSGAALLAHAGGWDEILLIGAPIVLMAGLLLLAKKRLEGASGRVDSDNPDAPHDIG